MLEDAACPYNFGDETGRLRDGAKKCPRHFDSAQPDGGHRPAPRRGPRPAPWGKSRGPGFAAGASVAERTGGGPYSGAADRSAGLASRRTPVSLAQGDDLR
jgi:hypothetical protein